MPTNSLRKSRSLRSDLLAQIARLSDQQQAALDMATFVGMTDEEARQIEKRRDRIAQLVKHLAEFDPERTPTEPEHYEIPAEGLELWLEERVLRPITLSSENYKEQRMDDSEGPHFLHTHRNSGT